MWWMFAIMMGVFFVVMWLVMRVGVSAAKDSHYLDNMAELLDQEITPSSETDLYYVRDLLGMEKSNAAEKLEECNRAIQADPEDRKARLTRAYLRNINGAHDDAIEDCHVVLHATRKDPGALLLRGIAFLGKRDTEAAVLDITEAEHQWPDQAEIYALRASAFYEAGEHDLAMSDARTALELDPGCQPAVIVQSLIMVGKGNREAATRLLQNAIHMGPATSIVFYTRALIMHHRGEHALALRDVTVAIDKNDDNYMAYILRSKIYQRMGHLVKATGDAQQALRRASEHPSAIDCMARLLATASDAEYRDGPRAVTMAKQACEKTGWNRPMLMDTLAAAYAEILDFEQAIQKQNEALSSPDYPAQYRIQGQKRLKLYQKEQPYREGA